MRARTIVLATAAAVALAAGGTAAGAAIASGLRTTSGACSLQMTLSGGTGDVFDVTGNLGNPYTAGVTSATETASGTYFVDVRGGTTGAAFTMSFTTS